MSPYSDTSFPIRYSAITCNICCKIGKYMYKKKKGKNKNLTSNKGLFSMTCNKKEKKKRSENLV